MHKGKQLNPEQEVPSCRLNEALKRTKTEGKMEKEAAVDGITALKLGLDQISTVDA